MSINQIKRMFSLDINELEKLNTMSEKVKLYTKATLIREYQAEYGKSGDCHACGRRLAANIEFTSKVRVYFVEAIMDEMLICWRHRNAQPVIRKATKEILGVDRGIVMIETLLDNKRISC